ncbi:MAG: phosphatase PAP2 family protein [Streptosporangiaceae bacterium]
MLRYLVVLIWPVGIALILGAGYLVARRVPSDAVSPASAGHRRVGPAAGSDSGFMPAVGASVRFAVISAIGTAIVVGLMYLLGLIVVYHGLAVDQPVFTWIMHNQVHAMTALMNRLTKIGDTWTTWGAAVAAAVCLAVTYRTRRWLPPVVLGAMLVYDHYAALVLRNIFHRLGPPTSPLGTYPSGGDDRAILFYGIIGFLLWYEFSGKRRAAVWLTTVVVALGFNEGYSRVYLSKHWFTDAVSGLLYGALLLIPFIVAIYMIAGRSTAAVATGERSPRSSPDLAVTGGTLEAR